MSVESLEDRIEIANPQHPHCPTVLLLDTSSSMSGDKIRQLNEGLRFFKDEVSRDDLARKRVDVAVVTFGGAVSTISDFRNIEDLELPALPAHGGTPMGEAILRGVEMVRERKGEYKQIGTDYFRPWIFLITDGEPTDMHPGDELWSRVVSEVHGGDAAKDFAFFGIGVEPADMGLLAQLCPPERAPLRLKPGAFMQMFAWLSKSTQRVSSSRVGELVPLENPAGPQGWAEIATI